VLAVLAESAGDPDLAPFVGGVHLGRSLLILGADGVPHLGYLTEMEREEAAATGCALLTPEQLGVRSLLEATSDTAGLWAGVVERALALCGLGPQPIAMAGHPSAGAVATLAEQLVDAGWRPIDGGEAVRRWRRRKTTAELAAIRRAAAGAGAAISRVAELLASATARQGELWLEGELLRVRRLRSAVAVVLAEQGLEQPHGNILAAGPAAGVPHSQGDSEHVVRAGEALVVDIFPRGGLHADCARTLCVGEAPAALVAAHAEVRAAVQAAARQARVGVQGWDLQDAVCARFAAAGWATPIDAGGSARGYVHGLGHGVGYELHELPSFRREAGEDGRLSGGDVFTLEPGLYAPDEGWGVRLEDLCWLGPTGLETLTPLPYELDPRAYRSTQ
jgi:Xaa-Pro aminopeptidase